MRRVAELLMVVLLLLGCGCVTEDEPTAESHVNPGDLLPEFSVVMNDGSRLTTDDLKGACSVIVFFNTDCADCRRELPVIQQLQDRNPKLRIVCIAREENEAGISKYWQTNGLSLRYSPQADRKIYNLFAESVIPRTYVSDSSLRVVAVYSGEERMNVAALEELIDKFN